jgi:mercuric ion transport protein
MAPRHKDMKTQASLAAGFLGAIGATACCFGPLLVITLGLGGVWAARMKELEPLQPIFVALTVGFMGFAFHRLYVRPKRCAPGEACELPQVLQRQRMVFWIVAAAVAMMAVFPLFADYFY